MQSWLRKGFIDDVIVLESVCWSMHCAVKQRDEKFSPRMDAKSICNGVQSVTSFCKSRIERSLNHACKNITWLNKEWGFNLKEQK